VLNEKMAFATRKKLVLDSLAQVQCWTAPVVCDGLALELPTDGVRNERRRWP